MNRPRLDEDIRSLSEFRARVASFVQQVRKTHRPVVITQRGRSAAVLLHVSDYEALLEQVELTRDMRAAERQLGEGAGIEHEAAKKAILARLQE